MTALARLEVFAERAGLDLNQDMLRDLESYRSMILDANLQFNLTRITDPTEFEQRVLIESIALLRVIPETATTLLDIGTGGGIPGLPLAIARPDLNVVLLDATAKKVAFLEATIAGLGLDNVTALQGRAEVLGRDPVHRDQYDVVTARAVARLATLAEIALPFVKPGGIAIFPKGAEIAAEYAEAQYVIRMLRGRGRPVMTRIIEGTSLIRIEKRGETPSQFPRRTGLPNKSPLVGSSGHGATSDRKST